VDSSIKFHDLACWTKSALEEMGALAVFLASEAAASITGVDGGWTAHWTDPRNKRRVLFRIFDPAGQEWEHEHARQDFFIKIAG
jgi:hypothetical protein